MGRAPKTKPTSGYYERHRIIPGCMGGKYVVGNIAWLTPEEHYVAHQLLVKIYPHHKGLIFAVIIMTASSEGQLRNNKEFGWIRRKFQKYQLGKHHSPQTEFKSGMTPWNKDKIGLQHTQETRSKIRIARSKQKIIHSEETKRKIGQTLSGKSKPIATCPNCGKKGGLPQLKQWHFDKCKWSYNENLQAA